MLRERRVLVVGRLAGSPAMLTLLRYAGVRLMAAADHATALHLARRFAIDLVIADAEEDEEELALFQREGITVIRPTRDGAFPPATPSDARELALAV